MAWPSGVALSGSTLVAGLNAPYTGYCRTGSSVFSAFGTLSSQPIAGQVIDYLVTGSGTDDGLSLVGNQSPTLLTTLYVDGIAWIVGTGVYNAGVGATEYPLTNSNPNFVNAQSYTVSTSPSGPTVYKSARTFAQASLGPRTKAQMYLGVRSFFL